MRLRAFIIVGAIVIAIAIVVPWRYRSPAKTTIPIDGQVHLEFQGIKKTEYGHSAQFLLQNAGAETLYYSGYSNDDQCSYKFKRNGTIVQKNPCWCGTGLAERNLEPGEAAHYGVDLTGETGRLQVGFDFEVGATRQRQTVWSQEFITF
jgi:hypothetical protein